MGDRLKDFNWSFDKTNEGKYFTDQVAVAVLMDIRDELKLMNQILQCPNTSEIPAILRDIRKNTKKRRGKR